MNGYNRALQWPAASLGLNHFCISEQDYKEINFNLLGIRMVYTQNNKHPKASGSHPDIVSSNLYLAKSSFVV